MTEPYVSNVISSFIHSGGALFVGNSMVIRDVDMYGKSFVESAPGLVESRQTYQYQGIQVAGNRGASGIDGLLSSAVGFSVGCKKKVSITFPVYLIHFFGYIHFFAKDKFFY